jgi:hypothetical protein
MPGETGVTVVTMLVCLFYFAREAAAHRAPGIPCALFGEEGRTFSGKTRAESAARSRSHGCRDACCLKIESVAITPLVIRGAARRLNPESIGAKRRIRVVQLHIGE